MKKLLALLLALVMVMALAACGNKNDAPPAADNPRGKADRSKDDTRRCWVRAP